MTVYCELGKERKEEWQEQICLLIAEAKTKKTSDYNEELESYYDKKIQHDERQEKMYQNKLNQNTFTMSETIKEELKQAAITYMSSQFFHDNKAMLNRVSPCGFPEMDFRKTRREGGVVRFFEQAFEWKFMSYQLYPRMWSRTNTWKHKVQFKNMDSLLVQKWLESGFARVTFSVRLGFENVVNYFLATGLIWSGRNEPPLSGPLFLPIHQEIKESKKNFNADREGYVISDSNVTSSLLNNEIILRGNADYLSSNIPPFFESELTEVDIDREIIIDCIVYRIVSVLQSNSGDIVVELDRDFESTKDKKYLWSTGAVFIGVEWAYTVPTNLVWLREDVRCLPCYPVTCKNGDE